MTVPIERLQTEFEITGFFYNPNIHPKKEYEKRLNEITTWTQQQAIPLIVHKYDVDFWFDLVKGFEKEPEGGKRCDICFKMRLEQTAIFAKQNGFDFFTTTLSISPHKNSTLINKIGKELGKKFDVQFLESNFKKKDGFKRSIELSKKYNFYRQNYCGCVYSMR